MLNVIQADRDAAADFRRAYSGIDGFAVAAYRNGHRDDSAAVQAFAKHRLDSTAELLEALEPFARFVEQFERRPMNIADEVYAIHGGTEFEAIIRLSDCRAARAAIQKARATPQTPGPDHG